MDNNHDCMKLYEMAIDEEHYFSASYDNRIAFFLKIISTLIGVTVVGFYKATSLSHYLFLSVGPITIAVTSNLAKESIKRTYQRFLEAVTVRAKLELDLGLTDERGNKNSKYWANEPYIFTRHIQSREDTNTSKSFVENAIKKGDQLWSGKLFDIFKYIGIAMLVCDIFLLFKLFVSK